MLLDWRVPVQRLTVDKAVRDFVHHEYGPSRLFQFLHMEFDDERRGTY